MIRRWSVAAVLLFLLAGCGSAPDESGPLQLTAEADGYQAVVVIDPAVVGANQYRVHVTDAAGQPAAGQAAVLHFSMPGMAHGSSEEIMSLTDGGSWRGDGPHLMMTGSWQIILKWTDEQGERHQFAFSLELDELQ